MKINDITTGFVKYIESVDGKVRPLLVVDITNNEALVYKITSKYKDKPEKTRINYFPIFQWKQAGLIKPSYIDTTSAIWLPKKQLGETLGSLSLIDIENLSRFLTQKKLNY